MKKPLVIRMGKEDDLVGRLQRHLKKEETSSPSNEPKKRGLASRVRRGFGNFLSNHKKGLGITALLSAGALTGLYFLALEYATTRQAYPIRNVLFQTEETIWYTGSEVPHPGSNDFKSETIINTGSNDGSVVGDLYGIFKIRNSDHESRYDLEDRTKTRIAFAIERKELFQAGLRWSGRMDFRERSAEIIGEKGKFITYTFIPKRGGKNLEMNVLIGEDGSKRLVNEIVTDRNFPLGYIYGQKYRSKAQINGYTKTPKNEKLIKQLFQVIQQYNNSKNLSLSKREKLVGQMLDIRGRLDKTPVVSSHEDGYFKILPQESSTYLFGDPDFWSRNFEFNPNKTKQKTGKSKYPDLKCISQYKPLTIKNSGNDELYLRVENQWDLFPGNIWLLNNIEIGSPPNVWRPFSKYNNGGYTIEDAHGVVAQVKIVDFWIHYGDDVLYKYYLDKNGNGKIDGEKELVGQVLFHVSRDERGGSDKNTDAKTPKKADFSVRRTYTFMAGHDWKTRKEDFYLSNAIESFMVNELNRGFGKHSVLGFINQQRSSILLLQDKTVPNLARALTPESSLVAKYDIVSLLRAAGRSYVDNYVSGPGAKCIK